jgi:hypothetical protein
MKKTLLLAVLALALPTAVFAGSSVDYTNSGGTLSGSTSGLTLTGSNLVYANGLSGGPFAGLNLGAVSFGTGALVSGSLKDGGTFSAMGSWFTVAGNGANGVPTGTLFTGTFSSPITLTLLPTLANGTHEYTLSGDLVGMASGKSAAGSTVQLTINTGKGFFNGTTTISSGDTNIIVPEPGSLGLLGTGLIGLAGVVRRKLKS